MGLLCSIPGLFLGHFLWLNLSMVQREPGDDLGYGRGAVTWLSLLVILFDWRSSVLAISWKDSDKQTLFLLLSSFLPQRSWAGLTNFSTQSGADLEQDESLINWPQTPKEVILFLTHTRLTGQHQLLWGERTSLCPFYPLEHCLALLHNSINSS